MHGHQKRLAGSADIATGTGRGPRTHAAASTPKSNDGVLGGETRREKITGAADTRLHRPPLLVRRAHPRTIPPPAEMWESPEGLSGLPMQALWNIKLQESVAQMPYSSQTPSHALPKRPLGDMQSRTPAPPLEVTLTTPSRGIRPLSADL